MTTPDPAAFLGAWRFERTLDDRLTGTRMHVAGESRFERAADDLILWHEAGTLRHPRGEVPVTATRRLRRGPGGDWTVQFADGRDFHPWAFGVDLAHDCAPDRYRGRLDPAPSGFRMEWHSVGPSKDYVATTLFAPA